MSLTKAIAIKYEAEKDLAPKVIASGKGEYAEKILECARNAGVPIHEDRELVEVLEYLEIDHMIPLEAYAAVAEILSYLYRVNHSLKAKGS